MRGQYRPREAIIGHETPLGRVPEIKKINIFFENTRFWDPDFGDISKDIEAEL